MKQYTWNILSEGRGIGNKEDVIKTILENRDIKTKEERDLFFTPKIPMDITLQEVGIDAKSMQKAIKRIKKAIDNKEHTIVYGDYDADGVCSTAIMWQTLYEFNKNTTPFMPDRFIDGYGLHADSIERLKNENPDLSLIITVDNGIVANAAVQKANELGIDVVITDHHQIGKELPEAHSIVHTDVICGSGVAWMVSRELLNLLDRSNFALDLLDLAAIGTIADQMPLVGVNRSFAKHGLNAMKNTKRSGLLALFETCNILPSDIGTYEINFLIAPRINAMGRLENAMESLRLLCTTNQKRAKELANLLGQINQERQKMVEEMVSHAKNEATKKEWLGAIVIAHETYHEGVIGLIASKLVDEYYRPVIVLSKKENVSKASARSIHGFNIIEAIRKLDHLLAGGGGHPMAAGFSIESSKIDEFIKEIDILSKSLLNDDLLQRKLVVDAQINIELIDKELVVQLNEFAPVGIGNPTPLFVSKDVSVANMSLVGAEKQHLKLQLIDDGRKVDAIAFGMGELYASLDAKAKVDVVYSIEINNWNGRSTIQLKIKDLKVH